MPDVRTGVGKRLPRQPGRRVALEMEPHLAQHGPALGWVGCARRLAVEGHGILQCRVGAGQRLAQGGQADFAARVARDLAADRGSFSQNAGATLRASR